MTLNVSQHRTILFQILKDIYADPKLSVLLGFKGGTAAMLFYGLDRFSVDLDFDLLDSNREEEVFAAISKLLPKYGLIKDARKKHFNLFWMLSYQDQAHNIKVEISRRDFDSNYELKNYLGTSMLVMQLEDMVAHKLTAMSERMHRTSRDIYDMWFFLRKIYPINQAIVEQRSGLNFNEFIVKCLNQLEEMSNKQILNGVGELLSERQKDWARDHLRTDLIALMKVRFLN